MKVRLVDNSMDPDQPNKWMFSDWWQNFAEHGEFQKYLKTRHTSYPHTFDVSYKQDYKITANHFLKSFNGTYYYTNACDGGYNKFILEFESEEDFLEFKLTWS